MIKVKDRWFSIHLPASEIAERIAQIAAQINLDYSDKDPLFIPVLNGAFVFAADLMRSISIDCQVSFIKLASYQGLSSSGQVEEILGLEKNLNGRHIIIIEDIVDTGLTMSELLLSIKEFGPASVAVATLLYKPASIQKEVPIDYIGFELDERFVIGYGLDYDGYGRNLPDIYCLNESDEI